MPKRVPRYIRLLSKKRGQRLLGSKRAGGWALVLFFTGVLAVGVVLLVLIIRELVIPQWRVNQTYVAAQAAVLEAEVQTKRNAEPPLYRPRVRVRFDTNGEPHRTWVTGRDWSPNEADARETLAEYAPGQTVEIWYDPLYPEDAVLKRGWSWFPWLMLLLPAAFLSFGAGGVIRFWNWGKSAEHLAVRRPRRGRALNGAAAEFPTIPDPAMVNESPGTTLAFRLAVSAQAMWRLMAVFAATVATNVVGLVLLGMALRLHRVGLPDRMLTAFSLACLAGGVGCVWWFIRELYVTTGVRPTIVEISDHPLRAGKEYDLYFSQSGGLVVRSLRITLVCEERATFRQGTDTRTERRRVFEDELFLREGFRIREGETFSIRCRLRLPPDAMHSFKAGCNEVNWYVLIEGEVRGQPEYLRVFPVIVFPRAA